MPDEARIRSAYDAYMRTGTLQKAGDEMGLTRERVRQLIQKGVRLKLFPKPSKETPNSPGKERLGALLSSNPSRRSIADSLSVNCRALSQWIELAGFSDADLQEFAREARKARCITEYERLVSLLGHAPTTTELENEIPEVGARALYARIIRYWGSFNAFRVERGEAIPPSGNPHFRKDVADSLERRRYLQYLRRQQAEGELLKALKMAGPSRVSDLEKATNLNPNMIRKLLRQLAVRGVIAVQDLESKTKVYVYDGIDC